MISSRQSNTTETNRLLTDKTIKGKDKGKRPPLSSCIAQAVTHRKRGGIIVLLGGADLLHFRLRVAQSHVRADLLPSYWSHAALAIQQGNKTVLYEVPLDPDIGFQGMPQSNGLRVVPTSHYDNSDRFPNVAVLQFPIRSFGTAKRKQNQGFLETAAQRVASERGILDFGSMILPWLGFAWGTGLPSNPLLSGIGIPSAAFVEAVFASVGVEVTPGLATKSSCPEAIWQAAKWWHPYYMDRSGAVPIPTEATKGKESPLQRDEESEAYQIPIGASWLGQRSASITVGNESDE
jgi:hypothetical protein